MYTRTCILNQLSSFMEDTVGKLFREYVHRESHPRRVPRHPISTGIPIGRGSELDRLREHLLQSAFVANENTADKKVGQMNQASFARIIEKTALTHENSEMTPGLSQISPPD